MSERRDQRRQERCPTCYLSFRSHSFSLTANDSDTPQHSFAPSWAATTGWGGATIPWWWGLRTLCYFLTSWVICLSGTFIKKDKYNLNTFLLKFKCMSKRFKRESSPREPTRHSPGTLAMQRTWELQTKKLSRILPGWLASMTTALLVDLVLVQIQTSEDISSCCRSSFCCSCTQKLMREITTLYKNNCYKEYYWKSKNMNIIDHITLLSYLSSLWNLRMAEWKLHVRTLSSWSNLSKLLWDPIFFLGLSGPGTSL